MRVALAAAVVCSVLTAASALRGQEAPGFPTPQKEHQLLQKFVGEWETDSESVAGPSWPAMKCKGAIQARMLGEFWMICEVENNMMGMEVRAIQTIGYDPNKKKYVSTWTDSVTDHLWQYEGTLDPTGKILTLEAEGPNMLAPGKTARFRDAYEFKSKDHVVATSSMQGEDGKWVTFMTGNSRRKAASP